jgi:hypothetical protein
MTYERQPTQLSKESALDLAKGLGWFSIALGLAQLMAPQKLAESLGMRGSEPVLQAYGLREIGTGVGILAGRDPTPWVWGRVGGDALDLATLTAGLAKSRKQENVVLAAAAVVGVTILDLMCAQALSQKQPTSPRTAIRDYSGRSGFPKPAHEMRGIARDGHARAEGRPATIHSAA